MTTQEQPEFPTPVRVWGENGDYLKHRCYVMGQTTWGYIHLTDDGRLLVIEGSGAERTMDLADDARWRAEELNGKPARVHYDKTVLDEEVVGELVFAIWESEHELATLDRRPLMTTQEMIAQHIAETGEPPITGDEFIRRFRALFETEEQRQRAAEELARGRRHDAAK